MKKAPVAIEEKEFTQLIKVTRKPHHKVAFLLGYGSGLRISEVIALQKHHIEMDKKLIRIVGGKGGKDRTVPLPKGFKGYMLAHIPLKCGVRSLQIAFRKYATKAGITTTKPSIHFHSLRHGFATRLVQEGMNVNYIRLLMGHSSIVTTNVYFQSNPMDAIKEYEKVF